MNNSVESPSARRGRRRRLHAGAVVAALALVPLAAKSLTTITDGLNVTHPTLNDPNTVYASAGVGVGNLVAGTHSFGVGDGNTVYGSDGNLAVGVENNINALSSVAFGKHNSISTAGPYGYDFAWGYNNQINANVQFSMAGGRGNIINGTDSMAEGYYNTTHGTFAGARGYKNTINSHFGQALGAYLTNNSLFSVAVGLSNAPFGTESDAAAKTTWRSQDSIFVVGNGNTDGTVRSNALVITKGGTAIFSQPVILQGNAIAGDIPMYTGN